MAACIKYPVGSEWRCVVQGFERRVMVLCSSSVMESSGGGPSLLS